DSVLGEVKALQPNHQNRLDAIERAEKARQRELESRRVGKFQKELGNFVQEGKLKKSGGVEEAERMREAKDEQARRDVWEQERARKQSLETGEEKPAGDDASGAQEQPGGEGSAPVEEKGEEKPERKYEPPSVEDEDASEQKGDEEVPVDAEDVAEEQKEEPASEA
ncbi:Bud site selection protein 6, partial [Ascosphaera atra]